jgi:light-regulated signal transduction histidine kinase (bacteriophytochrome)
MDNAAMTNAPDDKLSRLLSLSVHEFRTPISVVSGYLRMVLKDPAGILDDRYRRMLEEAEKSCGRLTTLVSEMSDLSSLEAGTTSFKKAPLDLRALLGEAIVGLPPLTDRTVDVELTTGTGPAILQGDAPHLKAALTAILLGLRREVVSEKLAVHERYGSFRGNPASWISVAEASNIESVSSSDVGALTAFDEWRGGCGLSLTSARRVINRHGGSIWSAGDAVKAAVIVFPQ